VLVLSNLIVAILPCCGWLPGQSNMVTRVLQVVARVIWLLGCCMWLPGQSNVVTRVLHVVARVE